MSQLELRLLFQPRLKALQHRAAQGDKPTYEDYALVLNDACRWWKSKTGESVLTKIMLKMIKGEIA